MNIDEQRQLIRRIQTDLTREGKKLRGKENDVAASDCEGQAEGLNDVLRSLATLATVRSTIETLLQSDKP